MDLGCEGDFDLRDLAFRSLERDLERLRLCRSRERERLDLGVLDRDRVRLLRERRDRERERLDFGDLEWRRLLGDLDLLLRLARGDLFIEDKIKAVCARTSEFVKRFFEEQESYFTNDFTSQ